MIKPGSVLMQNEARRPQCFHVEDELSPTAWMPVTHNLTPRELESELSSTGWTFFYMASPVRMLAFGFDRARMIEAALKRVIGEVKRQGCNCLQIDEVGSHSFLGMRYVSVSGHPRHIQKGIVFSGQAI